MNKNQIRESAQKSERRAFGNPHVKKKSVGEATQKTRKEKKKGQFRKDVYNVGGSV